MYPYSRHLSAVLTMLALIVVQPSEAAPVPGFGQMPMATSVSFDVPTLGPFAYVHFCVRYPDECKVRRRAFRRPRAVALDNLHWAALLSVNNAVNRSIEPMEYRNDVTFDTWRIAPREGDCNDFAVTKRHELLAMGWPSRSVLLSEVITPWGEHHLVLLVRTDRGDFVLDNLHRQIRKWEQTGYQWVRVQMPQEPDLWSTIVEPHRKALS